MLVCIGFFYRLIFKHNAETRAFATKSLKPSHSLLINYVKIIVGFVLKWRLVWCQLQKVSTTRACPSNSWRFVAQENEGSSRCTATKVSKRIKDEDDDFDNRGKRLRPAIETPRMQQDSAMHKRPYVFYGNIGELSPKEWSKISSFFFGIQPEHVDTRLCSTLSRKEGYMHNLPVENRFHILPKPTRSAPPPPPSIISSPENLECIMGYPPNHTNIGGGGGARLKLLDYCFQTDALGYHLSVLKPMFPQGLRVLSLFSGIGGAEIALSRLGIHLRSVCSVEPCGLSRSVLKRWWRSSGQSGELEQIEDIRSLRTKRLEALVGRFGGFDLVICQNPPTPTDLSRESSRGGACEFDFTLFNQVVRVSKLVRGLMESIWPPSVVSTSRLVSVSILNKGEWLTTLV